MPDNAYRQDIVTQMPITRIELNMQHAMGGQLLNNPQQFPHWF